MHCKFTKVSREKCNALHFFGHQLSRIAFAAEGEMANFAKTFASERKTRSLAMNPYFQKEDFELFATYGGQAAASHPEGHEALRRVYDKLGEIVAAMQPHGFTMHIRRNPQNQGQVFEKYHWAQLNPKGLGDTVGQVFFVVDLTERGIGLHIDLNSRQGMQLTDTAKGLQGWETIHTDEACALTLEQIVAKVDDYCHRHFDDFLRFGREYGIGSCIRLLALRKYELLLRANRNLILTGAPGTGKTFLARQLAAHLIDGNLDHAAGGSLQQRMEEQCAFVQFHPSYDYTDFMEGLRPTDDGQGHVVFRREDGILMAFCRKALKALRAARSEEEAPKYVLIIDEINRAELSKVFGELFFSIDPGYRGEAGSVRTQYANLWPQATDPEQRSFGGSAEFFIPQNVYVIGTMNDIDRSVESMDFALRRRFAFAEVKPADRLDMIRECAELAPHFDSICQRMNNLNRCVLTTSGLSEAFQIGPAYFLKLRHYLDEGKLTDRSWQMLWDCHLEGLFFEYLRGLPDATQLLHELHRAYDLKQRYTTDANGNTVKDAAAEPSAASTTEP